MTFFFFGRLLAEIVDFCDSWNASQQLLPHKQYLTFCKDNNRQSRSSVRGDGLGQFKKTFGQSFVLFFHLELRKKDGTQYLYILVRVPHLTLSQLLPVWLKENQIHNHWFVLNWINYDVILYAWTVLFVIGYC